MVEHGPGYCTHQESSFATGGRHLCKDFRYGKPSDAHTRIIVVRRHPIHAFGQQACAGLPADNTHSRYPQYMVSSSLHGFHSIGLPVRPPLYMGHHIVVQLMIALPRTRAMKVKPTLARTPRGRSLPRKSDGTKDDGTRFSARESELYSCFINLTVCYDDDYPNGIGDKFSGALWTCIRVVRHGSSHLIPQKFSPVPSATPDCSSSSSCQTASLKSGLHLSISAAVSFPIQVPAENTIARNS